jgi:hypothetical protein
MNSPVPSMFSDRQEQDLGDALAEYVESDLRVATPAASDQLTRVGESLLATLPPSGIHYRFRIYDSGEVNGFSLPGGHVYISRKLITAVKSEDDLAGVVAHEIGHIATHQSAIEMTRLFQLRLGINEVHDRADIFARVHQLFSTPAKNGDVKHDEKQELAADRVAVYAMARAGYAPESFATFFDRVAQNRGRTSNWFTNMFGITKEDSQRYTAAIKLIGTLPDGCKAQRAAAGGDFQTWVKGVVEERIADTAEGLTGDATVPLDPPLRPTFWRIRFSPDGKLLLGQDEISIVVADRATGKAVLRIDAPGAATAQFTPDSRNVVFHDSNLRVERWDTATGKRVSVRELVVMGGCGQTELAPDGRTLTCISLTEHDQSLRVGVQMLDVDSGKVILDKPKFYEPGAFDYRLQSLALTVYQGFNIVDVALSPDGHYGVFTVGSQSLAFDFDKQQPVALGGKLKGLQQIRMSFVGPTELAVLGNVNNHKMYDLRILSFPDGQLLKVKEIGDQQFTGATKGEELVMWPLKDYAVGLYDLDTGKIAAASKLNAMDAWGPYIATEHAAGGFEIFQEGVPKPTVIPVNVGPLPNSGRGTFSRDGRYLAVSLKNRAGVWDLTTGKQVGLIRPFQSVWMDERDDLYGEFPKYVKAEATELKITMTPFSSQELAKLDKDVWQYRNLTLHMRPMGKGTETDKHVTLEVKKMVGQQTAWSRNFNNEAPACWQAEDDRLVLGWDMSSDAAKNQVRAHPELAKELEALSSRKRGLLVETVAPDTGATLQQVVVPEADLTHGWNDVRRAIVSGDVVLARGEHENTDIYRLKDGSKVGEFFGAPVATSAALHLVAAENRENEILLVDETTGKEIRRFTLSSPVRFARIVDGPENKLLVLTADQVVHRIPLDAGTGGLQQAAK